MPKRNAPVRISQEDQIQLKELLSRGKTAAREQTRARILDLLHRGEPPAKVAEILGIGVATVYNVQSRYLTDGLEAALHDRPRIGRPNVFTAEQREKIRELAASSPPDGYRSWTLRLLAEKAVETGTVPAISHNEIRKILNEPDHKENSSATPPPSERGTGGMAEPHQIQSSYSKN